MLDKREIKDLKSHLEAAVKTGGRLASSKTGDDQVFEILKAKLGRHDDDWLTRSALHEIALTLSLPKN